MSKFPAFHITLLSKKKIGNITPCRLFSDAVIHNIKCEPDLGRLFGEFVYHAPLHYGLRDEFRRKLSQILDYMYNRPEMYIKSDHLQVLSQDQIDWLQSEYYRWRFNSHAVTKARRDHESRRYFMDEQEITVLELIKLDVATEIEKYTYPPYNLIERVAEDALDYMTQPELTRYVANVEELKEKWKMGFLLNRSGPGILPVSLRYRIKLFYEKRSGDPNKPQEMYKIFSEDINEW